MIEPLSIQYATIPGEIKAPQRLVRFVTVISDSSYRFSIWMLFPSDKWCTSYTHLGANQAPRYFLLDSRFVFVSAIDDMRKADLTNATFMTKLLKTFAEIARKDALAKIEEGILQNVGDYWYPSFITLVGRYNGDHRIIADSKANYIIDEIYQLEITHQQSQSKERFDLFVANSGAVVWPLSSDLVANPYRFEGQIIGLKARFDRMVDKTRALFVTDSIGSSALVSVNGVPSTMFSGKESVTLAGRVIGITNLSVAGAVDVPAIEIDYVGSYICNNSGCTDMFSWQE